MSKHPREDGGKASIMTPFHSNQINVHEDADNRCETHWGKGNQNMDKTKQKGKTTSDEWKDKHHLMHEEMETDETAPPPTECTTMPKQRSKCPANYCSSPNEAAINYYDGHSSPCQTQALKQLLRQTEASKQMLYGVFGNVITILEEHEKRTSAICKGKMKQSDISISDHSWKTDEDVKVNVETQLLLFQTQSKFCPEEVRMSVNSELRLKTIAWLGVREASKLDIDETDEYAFRLYEILAKGATKHDILDRPRSPVTEKTIREALPNIFKGKHDARELDESFRKTKSKKAQKPKTRQAEVDDAYLLGLSRIKGTVPMLKKFLDEDWFRIQHMGPDNIR